MGWLNPTDHQKEVDINFRLRTTHAFCGRKLKGDILDTLHPNVVLRALDWLFHVLLLPNMNVVVPLRFASHRLLRGVDWMFHVLRLPDLNVVVPLECVRVLCSSES